MPGLDEGGGEGVREREEVGAELVHSAVCVFKMWVGEVG